MPRYLLFSSLFLACVVSDASAHRIEGPDQIMADPGGSFEFAFTYYAPDFPFTFGFIHWGPLVNVAGPDGWGDGFCESGDGGWSITEIMYGQLIDPTQSGATIVEAEACDEWGRVELITTILPNPVTAVGEPDASTRLRSYPNPTRASVSFELVGDAGAHGDRVAIFDAAGTKIRSVPFAGSLARWDARTATGERVAPGVYFYRIDRPVAAVGRLVILD